MIDGEGVVVCDGCSAPLGRAQETGAEHDLCRACKALDPKILAAKLFSRKLRGVCPVCGGRAEKQDNGRYVHDDGKVCVAVGVDYSSPAGPLSHKYILKLTPHPGRTKGLSP